MKAREEKEGVRKFGVCDETDPKCGCRADGPLSRRCNICVNIINTTCAFARFLLFLIHVSPPSFTSKIV
jgi:hypothetical protein